MLKRRIFLGISLLLLTLIGVVTAVLVFSAIYENRQETRKHYFAVGRTLTGELNRLILWDDRVAVRLAIERQMETHPLIEYAFVVLEGRPYVDSFGGNVPADLLTPPPSKTSSTVWEFLDPDGAVYYDLSVPMFEAGAVLRLGLKRHNIDKEIYPVLWTILCIGFIALLVGMFFSHRIALHATREISLLCNAIQSYKSEGDDVRKSNGKKIEVAELAQSFRAQVSERKRAETELFRLQNYLSNIVDSMPSVLVGVNADGEVTQWNKMAEQTTQLPAVAAKGKKLADVFPPMATELWKITESIRTREVITELQKPRQSKDGVKYDDIIIYPLIANGVEGVVIRIDDVSEKVQLEEQLTHSHKMDAIGQLAGGVAHDFNNMLGAINGAAQLLKSPHRGLDQKGIGYVDMIMQSVTRAADLTAQLLAFGRKGKTTSTAVDIHAVVDDALAIFARTIDKKIKLTVAKDAANHAVIGDNTQLQSALMNLGINAAHAMPDGGEIFVGTKNILLNKSYCDACLFDIEPGEYIQVEVRDTGCGIPLEQQQKIFEPFFTTKKQGEGTGLGLAAVYGTVQGHRGAINVYSEVGAGTIFQLFLPCSGEAILPRDASMEVVTGVGKILLVDDENLIRIVGKNMLEEMGYEVFLAENGREAVEIFQKEPAAIDLVILDMIMPEMNGRDTFAKMREIDKNCQVIISSGFSKDESLDELKNLGLAGFIRKPYRDYELSRLVAEVLKAKE